MEPAGPSMHRCLSMEPPSQPHLISRGLLRSTSSVSSASVASARASHERARVRKSSSAGAGDHMNLQRRASSSGGLSNSSGVFATATRRLVKATWEQFEIFNAMSDETMQRIIEKTRPRTYVKGQIIVQVPLPPLAVNQPLTQF